MRLHGFYFVCVNVTLRVGYSSIWFECESDMGTCTIFLCEHLHIHRVSNRVGRAKEQMYLFSNNESAYLWVNASGFLPKYQLQIITLCGLMGK